jgi:hypothetical protein
MPTRRTPVLPCSEVARQSALWVSSDRFEIAHHLRFAQSRALGRKVSDEFVVPLCRGDHREVHRHGDEASWWRGAGIDPTAAARALWLEAHPLATDLQMGLADTAKSPAASSIT